MSFLTPIRQQSVTKYRRKIESALIASAKSCLLIVEIGYICTDLEKIKNRRTHVSTHACILHMSELSRCISSKALVCMQNCTNKHVGPSLKRQKERVRDCRIFSLSQTLHLLLIRRKTRAEKKQLSDRSVFSPPLQAACRALFPFSLNPHEEQRRKVSLPSLASLGIRHFSSSFFVSFSSSWGQNWQKSY